MLRQGALTPFAGRELRRVPVLRPQCATVASTAPCRGERMAAENDFVIFNGRRMHRDWPAKIEHAQAIWSVTIGGRPYARIRFGSEPEDWGASGGVACGDCGVLPTQFHVPGCDVERSPACGGQAIGCDCEYEGDTD